jgi:transcriptional regulator with XRE-family HTH domain
MSLLAKLIDEQRRRSLSDRAFARRLGVSQALWTNTRTGKVSPGIKVLAATAKEFPSLSDEIIRYLATCAPNEVKRRGKEGNRQEKQDDGASHM